MQESYLKRPHTFEVSLNSKLELVYQVRGKCGSHSMRYETAGVNIPVISRNIDQTHINYQNN